MIYLFFYFHEKFLFLFYSACARVLIRLPSSSRFPLVADILCQEAATADTETHLSLSQLATGTNEFTLGVFNLL